MNGNIIMFFVWFRLRFFAPFVFFFVLLVKKLVRGVSFIQLCKYMVIEFRFVAPFEFIYQYKNWAKGFVI